MTIHHRFRLLLGAGVLAIACMAGAPGHSPWTQGLIYPSPTSPAG